MKARKYRYQSLIHLLYFPLSDQFRMKYKKRMSNRPLLYEQFFAFSHFCWCVLIQKSVRFILLFTIDELILELMGWKHWLEEGKRFFFFQQKTLSSQVSWPQQSWNTVKLQQNYCEGSTMHVGLFTFFVASSFFLFKYHLHFML